MLKWSEEELKKHVRNLPCFTCLTRPLCIKFFDKGTVEVTSACDNFLDARDKIGSITSYEAEIIKKEILETLRKEKEEYAKSCENR